MASGSLILMAYIVNRKVILVASIATSVVTGLQYLLLQETSTVFLIAVSLLYSTALMAEKYIPAVRTHAFTALTVSAQVGGYFLFQGLSFNVGLIALAGTVLGTAALWFQDAIKLKITLLLTGVLWLTFQLIVGAYGQIPGEVVFLAGIAYSLIMLGKAHRNGTPFNEIPELTTLIKQKLFNKRAAVVPVPPSIQEDTPELAEIAA